MKINLRKIGAIVAGATILASTAAFAGLWFGDTMLVNDNGAPTVKVVVGENAAASDGVAASIAAGKIVGEAYKTEELTASIVGTPSCGEGEGEGAGTCSITNEKAQLEITVPGGVAEGTYTINTLIGDYVNRRLLDREINNGSDTDSAYPFSTSDTSPNANPLTDNNDGTLGPSRVFLYQVDGSMFAPMATQSLNDDEAAKSYTEEQRFWMQGYTTYDSDEEEIIGYSDFIAYSLKFSGSANDYGIPVCTTPTGGNYVFCKGTDGNIDYATETHKVRVYFLGEPWVISEMEAPTDDLTNEDDLVNGGYVKLAKESVSGILNQGESLPVDDLKFHLDDLEAHGDVGVSAIISVLDANDNILKKDKVAPGATKEFNIGDTTYRFHVYKVAPGYTFGAKWADVAIFSQELKLEDGQELDEDNELNEHYEVSLGWKNKDSSSTGAGCDPDDDGDDGKMCPDHLRSIVIWSEEVDDLLSGGEDYFMEGDYVPIVQDPVAWSLTYAGLDITNDDREYLTFKLEKDNPKTFSDSLELNAVGYVDCAIYPPYIEVTSGDSGAVYTAQGAYTLFDDGDSDFWGELLGSTTDVSDDEFYIPMQFDGDVYAWFGYPGTTERSGLWCDADDDGLETHDVTTAGDANLGDGVFMRVSPNSDYYGFVPAWSATGMEWLNGAYNQEAIAVQYDDIGDGDHELLGGGLIIVEPAWTFTGGGEPILCDNGGGDDELETLAGYTANEACLPGPSTVTLSSYIFGIAEKAGEGTSDDFTDYYIFGIDNSQSANLFSDATFEYTFYGNGAGSEFKIMSDDSDEIFYVPAGPVDMQYLDHKIVEATHVSERGSLFVAKDDDQVKFNMAHKLAHAQFVLASAEAAGEVVGTCIRTVGEGETTEPCNGVTVKVLEITEDVGPCTGGGAGAECELDMTGVSAVILPDNTATVSRVVPYANAYDGLVILDRDAGTVSNVVSIGGNVVNTVSADMLEGAAIDWSTERVVVREIEKGSKILVAGAEAEDTLEAVDQFVSEVRRA